MRWMAPLQRHRNVLNHDSDGPTVKPILAFAERPLLAAASTGRCTTSVKSFCRRFKLQRFAGPSVELARHLVQMSLRV